MDSISVIINTEKGRLEGESKMLIESIRQFGGRFKDVPIYSYQPRKGFELSKSTISFFEKHQVNYIDLPLNKNHRDYPLANKIYTCAHAEKNLKSDTIIFMDSDSVVWQEPSAFYEMKDHDVGMTPVFRKLSLAVQQEDENYAYWQRLQSVLKFSMDQYVQTVVDDQKVLAYYNSGLMVAKRSSCFFQSVLSNFEKLLKEDAPFFKNRFLEQSNFTATILSKGMKFKKLGKGYNYPLKHHGNIKNPTYQLDSLDEVITGHYTTLFKKAGYRNPLKGKLIEGEKGKWFRQKVMEYSIYKPWYRKLLDAI